MVYNIEHRNLIIDKHYRKNFKILAKKLAHRYVDIEDILQETYLRALLYWNEPKDFDNWFSVLFSNCIKDHYRNNKTKGMIDTEEIEIPVNGNIEETALANEIIEKINNEPDNIRHILSLYFLNQFTSKEISQQVKENHSNIRQIILRFRKKLK